MFNFGKDAVLGLLAFWWVLLWNHKGRIWLISGGYTLEAIRRLEIRPCQRCRLFQIAFVLVFSRSAAMPLP